MHESSENPVGEWNDYRILCNGGKIELYVNDVLQNEAWGCDAVAGGIALQSEGVEIHFKDIQIIPLAD